MFIYNKYTDCYYRIIEKGLQREELAYSEKHHIIPKSLGGNNDAQNLVHLTPREHYICHWLLTKMCESKNKSKMIWAFWRVSQTNNVGRTHTSRQYENARKIFVDEMKKPKTYEHKESLRKSWTLDRKKEQSLRVSGDGNPMFGRKHSKGTIEKMLQNRIMPNGENHHYYGKKRDAETRMKISETVKKRNTPEHRKMLSDLAQQEHRKEAVRMNQKASLASTSCVFCKKEIKGLGNFYRYHGNKCKMFSESNPFSEQW